ncbi:hypothetical protein ACFVZ4_21645 [Streptomyces goshikiensis]|uniref:hypothetical protein n=1 Tax=Streptomyces goshikiensis TaxID=1942 RepID=UPI0036BFB3F2
MHTFTTQAKKEDPWTRRLIRAADQFSSQAASIAELNSTVIPELEANAEDSRRDMVRELKKNLDKGDLDEFKRGAAQFFEKIDSVLKEKGGAGETGESNFSVRFKGSAGPAFGDLLIRFSRSSLADPHHQLLRNSLLVSTISGFEVFFGRVARSLIEINPSAFSDSDYRFTFQELSEFESMQDARDFLMERQVSKLLYESLDGWDKWLKRASGGVTMAELPVEWAVVREAFARRNLIVHADGVANHVYLGTLKKVDSQRDWGVEIGQKLSVDGEYLAKVLEQMLALGRLLSVALGMKIKKANAAEFENSLRLDVDRALHAGHWRTVKALSKYALLNCKLTRSAEISFQVSEWVARREIHGSASIRAEVECWDVSGLADSHSHKKHVLIGDRESVKENLRMLVDKGDITLYEVATNPLYLEFRGDFTNTPQGVGSIAIAESSSYSEGAEPGEAGN